MNILIISLRILCEYSISILKKEYFHNMLENITSIFYYNSQQKSILINMFDIGIRILFLYLSLSNTIVKNMTVGKMTDLTKRLLKNMTIGKIVV
jgi:hypothetical protein